MSGTEYHQHSTEELYRSIGQTLGAVSTRALSDGHERRLASLLEELEQILGESGVPETLVTQARAAQHLSAVHAQLAAALRRTLLMLRFRRFLLPRIGTNTLHPRLKALSPATWQLVAAQYRERYGADPYAELGKLSALPGAQTLRRLLDGETDPRYSSENPESPLPHALAELTLAVERRRAAVIWRLFARRGDDARKALLSAFDEKAAPSSLSANIRDRFRPVEAEILSDIIREGTVAKGKLLYYGVMGIGTDERSVRFVLQHTSPVELPEVIREFHDSWQRHAPAIERFFPAWFGELHTRLLIECGGDCWFDLARYFEPPPQSVVERAGRLKRWREYELSGPLLTWLRSHSPDERSLRLMNAELEHQLGEWIAQATPHVGLQTLRLEGLATAVEHELEMARDSKHLLGNLLSLMCTAPIAFGTVVTLTMLHRPLLHVIAGVAVASAASRFAVKALVKGRGYHREERLVDLCCSCLDGCTLFLSRFLRHMAIQTGTKFITKLAFRLGLARALQPAVLSELLHQTAAELENTNDSHWPSGSSESLLSELRSQIAALANRAR